MSAIIKVASCFATCPKCGDDLRDPHNGAFLISIPDHNAEDTFACETCGAAYKLPKAIFGKPA